jgi:hypothetical protein
MLWLWLWLCGDITCGFSQISIAQDPSLDPLNQNLRVLFCFKVLQVILMYYYRAERHSYFVDGAVTRSAYVFTSILCNLVFYFIILVIFKIFSMVVVGDQTLGFAHARQLFYH